MQPSPDPQRVAIAAALKRLRFAVTACCWVVGAALAVQMLIWSLSTFTDLRFELLEDGGEETLLVVEHTEPRERSLTSIAGGSRQAAPERQPVQANRVLSRWNRIFAVGTGLAGGMGTLGVVALVMFALSGLLVATGSATPGVDRTVSAFVWSVVVGMLVLPLGGLVGLPWEDGALVRYTHMIDEVELLHGPTMAAAGSVAASDGLVVFYARFLGLPAVSVIGLALVGVQFGAGVAAAMLPRPDYRLDPALEKELAGIRPTSLVGGRAAGALSRTVGDAEGYSPPGSPIPPVPSGSHEAPDAPSARSVSPGPVPKRLI